MTIPAVTDGPPLVEDAHGVIRIANTRIPLERVVRAFLAGATPENVVQDFDVLDLADVYAVINYYLHHRTEVDTYVARARKEAEELRREWSRPGGGAGLRDRLLARTGQ